MNLVHVSNISQSDILNDRQDSEQLTSNKDLDRNTAIFYIVQGKSLPKDLEQRLLRYKDEDKKQDRNNIIV